MSRNTKLAAGLVIAAVALALFFFVFKSDPIDELIALGGKWHTGLSDYGLREQKTKNLILSPKTEKEVQQIFKIASSGGLRISIRGGGHSMAGQSLPCGQSLECITVLTNGLKKWQLDTKRQVLVVGAGTSTERMYQFNKENKAGLYFPVLPDEEGPSLGGYLAAGGINAASFRYGGLWDNVNRIRFVTPSGEVKEVTPKDELFRYSFGGFGRFGLVTELELALKPVAKEKLKTAVYEGVFTPQGWLEAVDLLHMDKNNLWVMSNINNGTAIVEVRTTGNPAQATSVLKKASQGTKAAQKINPQGKKNRWLNLFCPNAIILKCFKELSRIKEEVTLSYNGLFAYKVKNSGRSVPLVHTQEKDFWNIGLWVRNKPAEGQNFRKLYIKFETVRKQLELRSYLTVQEIPGNFDFQNFYGTEVWNKWQALQDKLGGTASLKAWPPVQTLGQSQ